MPFTLKSSGRKVRVSLDRLLDAAKAHRKAGRRAQFMEDFRPLVTDLNELARAAEISYFVARRGHPPPGLEVQPDLTLGDLLDGKGENWTDAERDELRQLSKLDCNRTRLELMRARIAVEMGFYQEKEEA